MANVGKKWQRPSVEDLGREIAGVNVVVGDLRLIDLGRMGVRVEYGKPDFDGDYPACVVPRRLLEAVGELSAANQMRVLDLLGIAAADGKGDATSPAGSHAFSGRLYVSCIEQGSKCGVQAALAKRLAVPVRVVAGWCAGQAMPSESQALEVAAHFGWDRNEAMEDYRAEASQRAAAAKLETVNPG